VTTTAVKQRFEVANDLARERKKVLDACIPCQLFKKALDCKPTVVIYLYKLKELFQCWKIDFIGPLL
jgi:hypothetical protein